ncbi:hypothetical protein GCM10010124_18870 [Pilimelia terevasa]|uniref:Alpha/beta hydrolase n=1 Tax=Pilimelia terevasa TaxID=53372 RepID=A0A8J3BN43_9ACTN|nr:alpha/beta hydrolase [Pilimelia terevasa]GGK26447.1 hypothetical protein GCM10010124_18870 [Pilimelia terevasa]
MTGRPRVVRTADWADPVLPHARQVLHATPEDDADPPRPPLLMLPDRGHGAESFAARWLDRAAGRGHPAYALSPRTGAAPRTAAAMRTCVHDVVQVAAGLPRRGVLVGFGHGAVVARYALARYPAAAAVLLAPAPLGRWRRWRLGVPEALAGAPAVLVAGCPDDPGTSAAALAAEAAGYGGGPLLFPGRSADLLTSDAGIGALEAILDWLDHLRR